MSRQTADERFWSKVDTRGDCWLWQGALGSHGYGNFYLAGRVLTADGAVASARQEGA